MSWASNAQNHPEEKRDFIGVQRLYTLSALLLFDGMLQIHCIRYNGLSISCPRQGLHQSSIISELRIQPDGFATVIEVQPVGRQFACEAANVSLHVGVGPSFCNQTLPSARAISRLPNLYLYA